MTNRLIAIFADDVQLLEPSPQDWAAAQEFIAEHPQVWFWEPRMTDRVSEALREVE